MGQHSQSVVYLLALSGLASAAVAAVAGLRTTSLVDGNILVKTKVSTRCVNHRSKDTHRIHVQDNSGESGLCKNYLNG